MNKEKLISAIETCHPKLKEEIMYQLEGVDHDDETYDIVTAFEDAMSVIEDTNDKELLKYLKDFFIEIGYAVPVSPEQLNRQMVTSGKKYWFKKNGIYYDSVDSWSIWVEK